MTSTFAEVARQRPTNQATPLSARVQLRHLLQTALTILGCCALPSCSSGNASDPPSSNAGNGNPTTSSGGASGAGGQTIVAGMSGSDGFSGAAGGTAGVGGSAGASGQGGITGMLGPDLYVSPDGDDANPGTLAAPLKTLERARLVVRANKGSMAGDIHVYLRGGRYELAAPLVFDADDSGTNGNYINYLAYDSEQPVVSGGKMITGWTQVAGKPYYVANTPVASGFADYFRQLYVNGVRAYRASSSWIAGTSFYAAPAMPQGKDGINFAASALKTYTNVRDLRLLHVNSFKIDEWPVVAVVTNGSTTSVQCAQPHFQIRADRGFLAATDKFMIVNALQELDKPGEWYHDRAEQKVYYYPKAGETMSTAEVIAPGFDADSLVRLDGGAVGTPVKNIRFQGLVFEHGNWLYPRDTLLGGTQAEALYSPSGTEPSSAYVSLGGANLYVQEVPGDITLNHTTGIQFVGNTVRHMAACGIHLYNDVTQTLVEGNIFHDTTGAAIAVGRFRGAYIDNDIPGEAMVDDNVIRNNVIRDTGRDFMAATGISLMAARKTVVANNDIDMTAWSGIHVRMQTKGNYTTDDTDTAPDIGQSTVTANRVGQAAWASIYGVGDNGSIYTHGPNKDSVFSRNYVMPGNTINGFYNDDNSFRITYSENVNRKGWDMSNRTVDPKTILFPSNYGTGAAPPSSNCVVSGYTQISGTVTDWPQAATDIADAAGLEAAYKALLTKVPATPPYDYLK
jgi:hypothetical protein